MKKLLLIFFLLFSMAGGAYYWFIAHPGYAPKVNSYGNLYNRLIADSALHIPNKSCLCTNDNDTTPQLFIYMDTVRGFWNGVFHNIGFGSGGGSGVDTIYVTQIGSGSPQIPLVYAVNGSLRVARLVPGVFTTPFMNADSAAGINIDTAGTGGIAYKLWIIAQYGPPSGTGLIPTIYNSDGTVTGTRNINANANKISWLNTQDFLISVASQKQLIVTDSLQNTSISIGPGCCFGTYTQRGSAIISSNPRTTQVFGTIALDSGTAYWSDQFGNSIVYAGPTTGTPGITMAPIGGNLTIYSIPSTTDTTKKALVYDPLTDHVSYMDLWSRAGSGGGGSSFTRQSITSGTSGTVTGGKYIVTFNPASVIATYTLTLPASPSDMDEVEIEAGGTVTSGNPVVTALTISPNSGQTLVQAIVPSTINSGEFIKYRYRTGNTSWYRRN